MLEAGPVVGVLVAVDVEVGVCDVGVLVGVLVGVDVALEIGVKVGVAVELAIADGEADVAVGETSTPVDVGDWFGGGVAVGGAPVAVAVATTLPDAVEVAEGVTARVGTDVGRRGAAAGLLD